MTAAAPMPDHAVTHAHGVPNGTTVFLLHGAFGAKEYWRAQVRALAQAGSAWQAANRASSAACASVENEAGSTISGGATPSITTRRTACGNWRRYSSAARVP